MSDSLNLLMAFVFRSHTAKRHSSNQPFQARRHIEKNCNFKHKTSASSDKVFFSFSSSCSSCSLLQLMNISISGLRKCIQTTGSSRRIRDERYKLERKTICNIISVECFQFTRGDNQI